MSANPTGPLHVGHGRGAAVGDALARILEFTGHKVVREYYVNDVGNQMDNLGRSLLARYRVLCGRSADLPEDGYRGEYMIELARDVRAEVGDRYADSPEGEALPVFRKEAGDRILLGIRDDLASFRVTYDRWFAERDLHDRGLVAAAIAANFERAMSDEKSYRRMLAQIGTPRASEDATTLKCVLKGRDVLANLAERLPLRIGNLADDLLDDCKLLIDGAATRDRDLLLYGLPAVMSRLAAPWQLIRLGIVAAGSDTAARVAETPYGVSVTIVLAELDRMVGELRHDLHSGHGVAVGASLKTIHDSARGLRTELELPIDSTWGRALAAQRTQIADLLRSKIESMPGQYHLSVDQLTAEAEELRSLGVAAVYTPGAPVDEMISFLEGAVTA